MIRGFILFSWQMSSFANFALELSKYLSFSAKYFNNQFDFPPINREDQRTFPNIMYCNCIPFHALCIYIINCATYWFFELQEIFTPDWIVSSIFLDDLFLLLSWVWQRQVMCVLFWTWNTVLRSSILFFAQTKTFINSSVVIPLCSHITLLDEMIAA